MAASISSFFMARDALAMSTVLLIKRRDAGAAAAAGHGDADFGVKPCVVLGPGQREVDQRIGARVLDRARRLRLG